MLICKVRIYRGYANETAYPLIQEGDNEVRKEARQRDKYYFPNRLTHQLNRMAQYPLTVVEAPSGFGKTTAVREYLKELPESTCVHWYTCLEKPVSVTWEEFCGLFAGMGDGVANDLKNLGVPTIDTFFHIESCLKKLRCPSETYLVVDNYQLIDCNITNELLEVLSMHENPNLHMVFITQQLRSRRKPSIHNNNIHMIDASVLFFDKDSTDQLLRLDRIRLGEDELDKMFKATEGWVSAIRLQAIHLKETGAFSFNSNIERLVEAAIWDRLDLEEKEFLLSISILDDFTTAQASVMLGQDSLPEKIETFLKGNDFIRYFPDQHVYSVHSILQDYLRNRFYHFCTEEYRKRVFRKAGASCAAISQNYPAAEFYYKIRDFDAILSLPFTIECLDKQKEKSQFEFIVHIANECPDETWCKYPFAMIAFGYYALMMGQRNTYQKLSTLLQRIIRDGMGFSKEELRRIEGESILLTMAANFNDLPRAIRGLEKAFKLLEGSSRMLNPNVQWMFATPSVLNMFWNKSGQLDQTLDQIDAGSPLFDILSNKQGVGYHLIMRGEAMLLRGEADKAEILCHEALYLARRYKQTGMCVCGEFTLAKVAILKGDTETFFAATENLQRYAREGSNPYITNTVEYCMSVLGIYLGIEDYISPWFYDMKRIRDVLYAPIVPLAQTIHLWLLLRHKKYHEFYGVCYRILDESEYAGGDIKYMMSQLYTLLLLVAAEHKSGRYREAEEYFREAIDMALPDQIYLPFAHFPYLEEYLSKMILNGYGVDNNGSVPLHVTPGKSSATGAKMDIGGKIPLGGGVTPLRSKPCIGASKAG